MRRSASSHQAFPQALWGDMRLKKEKDCRKEAEKSKSRNHLECFAHTEGLISLFCLSYYICAHIHRHIQRYTHTHTRTHTQSITDTQTYTQRLIESHSQLHPYTYTDIYTYRVTEIRVADTETHILQIHTHIHRYTQSHRRT